MRIAVILFTIMLATACVHDEPTQPPTPVAAEFTAASVAGLRLSELQYNPDSVVRYEGEQRVQVAAGYWVKCVIDVNRKGNGLLYVHDDRGECLRTRIYDAHQEDETWEEIEGWMFDYGFVDDDEDGELELIVSGHVITKTEEGIINRRAYRERWERLRGQWPWVRTQSNFWQAEFDRPDEPEKWRYTEHELGTDHAGRQWTVVSRRMPGSDTHCCRFLCDDLDVGEFEHYSRFASPRFELQTAASESFAVAGTSSIHGTGISGSYEHWYRLSPSALEPVFGYCSTGYRIGWGLPYYRDFSVGAELHADEGLILNLTGKIEFDESQGFSATRTASYKWNPVLCRFVATDETAAEAVEDMMWGSTDWFLKHFHPEIRTWAQAQDEGAQDWLNRLVEASKEPASHEIIASIRQDLRSPRD
jgi:hypothetical protein